MDALQLLHPTIVQPPQMARLTITYDVDMTDPVWTSLLEGKPYARVLNAQLEAIETPPVTVPQLVAGGDTDLDDTIMLVKCADAYHPRFPTEEGPHPCELPNGHPGMHVARQGMVKW